MAIEIKYVKVRVCSKESFWYANHIEEVFKVTSYNDHNWVVLCEMDCSTNKLLFKQHCKIVPNPTPKVSRDNIEALAEIALQLLAINLEHALAGAGFYNAKDAEKIRTYAHEEAEDLRQKITELSKC